MSACVAIIELTSQIEQACMEYVGVVQADNTSLLMLYKLIKHSNAGELNLLAYTVYVCTPVLPPVSLYSVRVYPSIASC